MPTGNETNTKKPAAQLAAMTTAASLVGGGILGHETSQIPAGLQFGGALAFMFPVMIGIEMYGKTKAWPLPFIYLAQATLAPMVLFSAQAAIPPGLTMEDFESKLKVIPLFFLLVLGTKHFFAYLAKNYPSAESYDGSKFARYMARDTFSTLVPMFAELACITGFGAWLSALSDTDQMPGAKAFTGAVGATIFVALCFMIHEKCCSGVRTASSVDDSLGSGPEIPLMATGALSAEVPPTALAVGAPQLTADSDRKAGANKKSGQSQRLNLGIYS